jgi:hypothetical protein
MLSKLINLIVVIFLAFAFALILSNSMAKPVSRDEQMYCSAAVLLSQGQTPYKDFAYVAQLPYHPLLLSAIYKITGTTHYLLTARIVSCLADFLTVLFIILIYRKVFSGFPFSGLLFGLAAATLFLFNPFVNYIIGLAWNHNIVICLVAASFRLYLSLDRQGKANATLRSSETSLRSTSYWKIALIAALLTFATCMRITTALIELLFFIALLFRKYTSTKEKLFNALIFILSSVLVLTWLLWIIAQAPKAFLLNLFVIPKLNAQLLVQMGLFYNKLKLTFLALTSAEYLFPLLITIYVYVLMLRSPQAGRQIYLDNSVYLAISLPITFLIIAFIPPTFWFQYLAIPLPFLLISTAFPLFFLRQKADSPHLKIASSLIATCVLIAVIQQITILKPMPTLSNLQTWEPLRLHNFSTKITQNIDKSAPVLTISPLYALEGSCRIYPQLSAGLFAYRIADDLTDNQRQITNTVGPASLKQLLKVSPPSAVIVGTEQNSGFGNLENTLLTAVGPDWSRLSFENGLYVYTKP